MFPFFLCNFLLRRVRDKNCTDIEPNLIADFFTASILAEFFLYRHRQLKFQGVSRGAIKIYELQLRKKNCSPTEGGQYTFFSNRGIHNKSQRDFRFG